MLSKRFFITNLLVVFSSFLLSAQSIESLMSSGNSFLRNGAYDQAATKYRKVVSRDPGNFEAQFNLGLAYLNMGDYQNSVKVFKRALGIKRNSTEGWSNLAIAYDALGKEDLALQALYQAVRNNPSNVNARMNLATMYANKKYLSEAITQYQKVISIDGTNVDAYLFLAKCLISQGKALSAVKYLKELLSIEPTNAEACWELGNISWKKNKNTDKALEYYKKAISLEPNSKIYYENLALLYEELDNKPEAIKTWKKLIIYTDDALKKENVKNRIKMLKRGESPSRVVKTEDLFKDHDLNSQMDDLKNEVNADREEAKGTKIITTNNVDFMSDLDDLDKDDGNDFSNFDMNKAIRKKKREKK